MIEMAKLNQAIKAKRKLEAVREKQKEVDTNNCWRKHCPADVSAVPSKKRRSK